MDNNNKRIDNYNYTDNHIFESNYIKGEDINNKKNNQIEVKSNKNVVNESINFTEFVKTESDNIDEVDNYLF
jgi:hypothetical protein